MQQFVHASANLRCMIAPDAHGMALTHQQSDNRADLRPLPQALHAQMLKVFGEALALFPTVPVKLAYLDKLLQGQVAQVGPRPGCDGEKCAVLHCGPTVCRRAVLWTVLSPAVL